MKNKENNKYCINTSGNIKIYICIWICTIEAKSMKYVFRDIKITNHLVFQFTKLWRNIQDESPAKSMAPNTTRTTSCKAWNSQYKITPLWDFVIFIIRAALLITWYNWTKTAPWSFHSTQTYIQNKQEIAANYEKYIRARDPFPWRSIHQNLNSLGNSFCSDSNLAGATLCRYNFCTWQVWHETHICCQGMRKICSDDQKMKYDKMKF